MVILLRKKNNNQEKKKERFKKSLEKIKLEKSIMLCLEIHPPVCVVERSPALYSVELLSTQCDFAFSAAEKAIFTAISSPCLGPL